MKKKLLRWISFILFCGITICFNGFLKNSKAEGIHSLGEKISDARESLYTSKLINYLKKWPLLLNFEKQKDGNPVFMTAIKTLTEDNYIGVEKQIFIQAPILKVSEVIENFENYPNVFEGVKSVKVVKRDGNCITTQWERQSPVFFVPNIKYEQVYIIDRSNNQKIIYRYQLKKGNSLLFSDGIIVLDTIANQTRLTAIDFYFANWGILKSIANNRIWKGSLEGSYRGDISLKAHIEHPEWTKDQLIKESESELHHFPVESIQFRSFLAETDQ